jgi:hypothetical protein
MCVSVELSSLCFHPTPLGMKTRKFIEEGDGEQNLGSPRRSSKAATRCSNSFPLPEPSIDDVSVGYD